MIALFLWTPALGIPVGPLWLQPVDFLVVLSYPLVIAYLPQLPKWSALVIAISIGSALLATLNSGDPFIFLYYLGFVTPFMMLLGVIASRPDTRRIFVSFFAIGGTASMALFLAQILIGADALDFRTNQTFGLPKQYNRGFAFFPEVSTFSTHAIYFLGLLIMFSGVKSVKRLFPFGRIGILTLAVVVCVLFTRSTSILVIAPAIVAVAYFKGRRLSFNGILGSILMVATATFFLQFYVEFFYAERAASGGIRSAWVRGISIVSGLSVLSNGEVLGVGLGNNHLITQQAVEVARRLNFNLIFVPEGINSFVVTRIFEEGWPAVATFFAATVFLIRVWFTYQIDPYARAFAVLAIASFLVSLSVTGYRGIYMNWFWLAAAPALVDQAGLRRIKIG